MSPLHHRAPPALAVLLLVASLAACGGGGNESGPPDAIQLSDDSVKVTSATEQCYIGQGPTVYIYGGQPPYKLYNSVPLAMGLDKASVSDSGGSFTVFLNGVCLDDVTVTIEDDMGRLATLFVTNEPGL